MICEGTISHWLSKVILRTCSDECKLIYRKFEKFKIRITNGRFHLQFNLACINNDLLPTYTNIYIYIYVCQDRIEFDRNANIRCYLHPVHTFI